MTDSRSLPDHLKRDERKIICWECGGTGVMAKDSRAVPCEVCQNEYGELVVVPKHEVERLREDNAQLVAAFNPHREHEIERLQEALRWIATYGENNGDLKEGHEAAMRNIARNTLGLDEERNDG